MLSVTYCSFSCVVMLNVNMPSVVAPCNKIAIKSPQDILRIIVRGSANTFACFFNKKERKAQTKLSRTVYTTFGNF